MSEKRPVSQVIMVAAILAVVFVIEAVVQTAFRKYPGILPAGYEMLINSSALVLLVLPCLLVLIRFMHKRHSAVSEQLRGMVQQSNERFRLLCENLPDPVEIYDATGKQVMVNKAYEDLWEIKSDTTLEKFNILHEPVRINAHIIDHVYQAYSGDDAHVGLYKLDTAYYRWMDRPKWVKTNVIPLDDSATGKKCVMIIHEDQTAAHNLQLELEDLRQQFSHSDQMRNGFLRIISHELRTPLNWIMGFTHLLTTAKSEKKASEYLKIINASGNTLLSIIDLLIDISMLEADEITVKKEEFILNELITEIMKQFEQNKEMDQGKVDLRFLSGNEPALVYTDRDMLNRILVNLLDNALKYTEKGSVELGYKKIRGGEVTFFIKDTGMGIPEDQRDQVFEKFKKGDESEKRMYSGTGLGLSVSKGFVEKLGGRIWFDSEVGQGSTFYFKIPVVNGAEIKVF